VSLVQPAISPSGAIHLEGDPAEQSAGLGVLVLGARDADADQPLEPSLAFFRELGRRFVTALCALPEAREVPPPDDLDALVRAAPPMKGLEYLDEAALARLWSEMNGALAQASTICRTRPRSLRTVRSARSKPRSISAPSRISRASSNAPRAFAAGASSSRRWSH
jgi:hypothetical protein